MIEEISCLTFQLACFIYIVVFVTFIATATIFYAIPAFTVPTYRLLTFTSCTVEDGISRITMTSIIVRIVCLVFIAHGCASVVSEVVSLPSHAVTVNILTFF